MRLEVNLLVEKTAKIIRLCKNSLLIENSLID
jgi:hypothetical protein